MDTVLEHQEQMGNEYSALVALLNAVNTAASGTPCESRLTGLTDRLSGVLKPQSLFKCLDGHSL